MESYDFEYRAKKRDTYSVFGCVWELVFDWFQLSEPPGIDWDASWLLRLPLSMNSNSSFFTTFSSFCFACSCSL